MALTAWNTTCMCGEARNSLTAGTSAAASSDHVRAVAIVGAAHHAPAADFRRRVGLELREPGIEVLKAVNDDDCRHVTLPAADWLPPKRG
jgi:hypothetical protein